jgi:thiopeptide-type bacteriocin biosynthesis protein
MMHRQLVCSSTHVFDRRAKSVADLDLLIIRVVAPTVRELYARRLLKRFFFIRYAEGGLHVRVRLFSDDPGFGEAAVTLLAERIAELEGDLPSLDGHGVSLAWQPYAPEFARYGGYVGLAVAEELFEWSSEYALAVIAKGGTVTTGRRLAKGLLATLTMLRAFGYASDELARFGSRYGRGYLPGLVAPVARNELHAVFRGAVDAQQAHLGEYVSEFQDRFACGVSLTPELDAFAARLESARESLQLATAAGQLIIRNQTETDWHRCVDMLAPSYVHMTNNRLGITPMEEAYLAHVIARFAS